MIKLTHLIIFSIFLLSCSDKNEYQGKKVHVHKDTKTYFNPEEENQTIAFVFTPKDRCIFTGERSMKKMFAYDEIDCEKRGKAWILSGTGR